MHAHLRSVSLAAACLCLALVAAGCDFKIGENGLSIDMAHAKATDEWTRTYTIAPGGTIEIVGVNGEIEAFPATGTEVQVVARRELRGETDEGARTALQKLRMIEETTPNRVKVEAAETSGSGVFGGPKLRIQYRVSVPPGINVTMRTQNGGVRAENLKSNVVASTTNGGVTGRGLAGALEARTVNGGIQVELDRVTGDTTIETVNGGVRLALGSDVNAELEASAVNGGVSVAEELPFVATDRARLHVSGKINKGGPRITLQTTNGGIRVTTADRAEDARRGS